jgi:enoyl-CoA hydratase/carnithine racemase
MFGFPEADLGVMPGFGGTVFSSGVVLRGKAMELMLSSRLIGADEANRMGLVDQVSSPTALEEASIAFLKRLVGSRPAPLVRNIMQAIHGGRRLPIEEALALETELFCETAGEDYSGR